MIIIDSLEVNGLEWSIVRSGNPKTAEFKPVLDVVEPHHIARAIKLGQCDIGTGHDSFLKGIRVAIDMWMPLWMHAHMQRYNHIDWVSCMSIQHNMRDLIYSDTATMDLAEEDKQRLRLELEEHTPFEEMVKKIPQGLLLGCSFVTNYLQLKTVVAQRKYHKMEEWREFCQEIMHQCPMFCELTGAHYMSNGERKE